ncbi:MAG: type II toxin-antitoxin system RelE/ParE family toxin [Gammaproteobacteria bacterium]|nr:type II toxin-antitoxin system RelE/ParE family toxin [Gammaproteobacteria bacterium]
MTYRILEGECRCSFLRRFPYSLVYRPEPDGILVVAVFHHRRDPATWHDRVARKPDSRPG